MKVYIFLFMILSCFSAIGQTYKERLDALIAFNKSLEEQKYSNQEMEQQQKWFQQSKQESSKTATSSENNKNQSTSPFIRVPGCVRCGGAGFIQNISTFGPRIIQCGDCIQLYNIRLGGNASYNITPSSQRSNSGNSTTTSNRNYHNTQCFKCHQTGRYTCPCRSAARLGQTSYHNCDNCGMRHEIGTSHSCQCTACRGSGRKQ